MDTGSIFINVIPSPVVTISSLPDTMCITDSPIALSGLPLGGLFSGTGISGGLFSPTLAGQGTAIFFYSYSDTISGCSSSAYASIYVDSCIGQSISDPALNYVLTIYPNPANTEVVINIFNSTNDYFLIKLLDASSRIIVEKKYTQMEGGFHLNLENIEDGIYFILIQGRDQSSLRKIIVQH